MIEPKDTKNGEAFLLEFKVHEKEDGDSMEDTIRLAHAQMEKKQYAELNVLFYQGRNGREICRTLQIQSYLLMKKTGL